jgi:hypothetical protein
MDQMPPPSDVIAQSTTHVSLLAMASNAFQEAKEGGEYSKHYERYKDEYTARLNRAAKSYERVIREHWAWIENPYLKLPEDTDEETIRRYVEQKWPDDITRNQAYKDIIMGILMERQNAKR